MEMAGHSTPSMTLATYAKTLKDENRTAMDNIASLIQESGMAA
jgi:hypothetical protein